MVKKGITSNILILIAMLTLILSTNQNFAQKLDNFDPKQTLASIKKIISHTEINDIKIYNNSAFGDDGYGFPGTGTFDDPYLIHGYNITDNTGYLIHIENTSKYFQISNCYLDNLGNGDTLIHLNNVTHGMIENNIANGSNPGICIEIWNSVDNILSNNTISMSDVGIEMRNSHNNTMVGNLISNCDRFGIYMWYSDNNTLWGNTISNNTHVNINMFYSHNNTLWDNKITNSSWSGIEMRDSHNNTMVGNLISNCATDGIYLVSYSQNNAFWGNIISNCGYRGIYMDRTTNNAFWRNLLTNNIHYGIYMESSPNNAFWGNTFSNCGYRGIYSEDSCNNIIRYNVIYNNTNYGLAFDSLSYNNTVNWNNFVENNLDSGFNQSSDVGINNNISYNYWNDHTNPDNNNDGIVDTPYDIEGGSNQDIFPLTKPMLPKVTIESPMKQDYGIDTITIQLSGYAIKYWYYIVGIDDKNQTWTTDVHRTLADGVYTLHGYGSDILNNINNVSVIFTVDTSPPSILLESPTNSTTQSAGTTINLTVIDLHLETVLYNWDGGTNQTLFDPYDVTLPSDVGLHVLRVYAKDVAGHWNTQTYTFRILKPADLGVMIGASIIVISVAGLAGGSYYFFSRKSPKSP